MDIDGGHGCKPPSQVVRKPRLEQPAPPPGDDVDRRTIGTTVGAGRDVIDRHTWLVS
jgi:hypothetical protein